MKESLENARSIVSEYTGGRYAFGSNCTDKIGEILAGFGGGKKICVIMGGFDQDWSKKLQEKIKLSFAVNGLSIHGGIIRGAKPDAPAEDVVRIASMLGELEPNLVLAVGGGSTIEAAKAAIAFWKLHRDFPNLEKYEGEGVISSMFAKVKKTFVPLVAVQTSFAPSHINRFAAVFLTAEKRTIHLDDPILMPSSALFDCRWTMSIAPSRIIERVIEAFSNCLETYMTYDGEYSEYIEDACITGMDLILESAAAALEENVEAREAAAIASDISGIALMTAKPNGGHLSVNAIPRGMSRPLVCAILNPYYLVFYSTAIENRVAKIANLFVARGFMEAPETKLSGRELGEAAAEAINKFYRTLKIPSRLSEIPNLDENVCSALLEGARKELSKSSFKQLSVGLTLLNTAKYLRLVYQAAFAGDYPIIMNF
jgi:alcohol dehydrogenase